jgi:hypothetical protein
MTQTQMPTIAQLTVIGEVICQVFTPAMIREMHSAPEGAEQLRLIVRDDLGGAAETITNALWDTL